LDFFTFGNVVLSEAKNLYEYLRDPSLSLRVTSNKRNQKFQILSLRCTYSQTVSFSRQNPLATKARTRCEAGCWELSFFFWLSGFAIRPRDATTAAEWDFHNTMLAVKEQVIAQFGKNSDQVQALGLKKKSEYKAPARRGKAKTA
jgi:hypothetical protein